VTRPLQDEPSKVRLRPGALAATGLAAASAGLLIAVIIYLFLPGWMVCHNDLPLSRWRAHDLTMLDGTWRRFSNMKTKELKTGRIIGVRSWTFSFDHGGEGVQTLAWDDGNACRGPVGARFDDTGLLILDAEDCNGGESFVATTFRCRWIDASVADCSALERDPSWREGRDWSSASEGLFRR
jgi:hypothetical protein